MTYYVPQLAYEKLVEMIDKKLKTGASINYFRVPVYDSITRQHYLSYNLFRGDTGFLEAYEGKNYGSKINKNDEYTKKMYDYLFKVKSDIDKENKYESNMKKIHKLVEAGKQMEAKIKAVEFIAAAAESKDDLTKNKYYFKNKTAKNLLEELVEYHSNNEVSKAVEKKIEKAAEAYNAKMREFKKI